MYRGELNVGEVDHKELLGDFRKCTMEVKGQDGNQDLQLKFNGLRYRPIRLTKQELTKEKEIQSLKESVAHLLDLFQKQAVLDTLQFSTKITGTVNPQIFWSGIYTGNSPFTESTKDVWQQVEYPKVIEANHLSLAFYDADSREYTYDLEVSEDQKEWIQIKTSAKGQGVVQIPFKRTKFKWLRIKGTNTLNGYLHLTLFKLRLT